jgi:methyl-accepting chemotaxis protein
MKLPNPSIKITLLGFALCAVIVSTAPAVMTLAGFSLIGTQLSSEKASIEILRTALAVRQAVAEMESAVRGTTSAQSGDSTSAYQAADKKARSALHRLKTLVAGNTDQLKHVVAAESLLSRSGTAAKPIVGKSAGMPSTNPGNAEILRDLRQHMVSMSEEQVESADKVLESATGVLGNLNIAVYTGIPVYLVVMLVAAFVLARYVAGPIEKALAFTDAITRGDMSHRLAIKGFAEARSLEACLNVMADSLVEYNQRIREGVAVLTGSVAQIASTASQVLTSASQTVSAVNETTAIVGEMERGAKVVNETARRVAEHSEQSDEIASAGTKATNDTLQKMNLIKEKMGIVSEAVIGLSDKTKFVESIISAVQDLADQSNLLAVNASIEAARAGEHGKGFAVVASEIKSLADQSRDATQRVTRTLQEIRNSVGAVVMATEEGGKAVMGGVEQSEAAGIAIQKLAGSIGEFSQAAGIIFASSGKQFSRVERIALAMRNVELAMNSSAEGTTHVENEAKRLEQLAQTLTGLVRHHTVDERGV